jgi:hypothetical protein
MDRQTGHFGLIVSAVVVVAAMLLVMSGGELGGKKTIDGDQDLPPLATAER